MKKVKKEEKDFLLESILISAVLVLIASFLLVQPLIRRSPQSPPLVETFYGGAICSNGNSINGIQVSAIVTNQDHSLTLATNTIIQNNQYLLNLEGFEQGNTIEFFINGVYITNASFQNFGIVEKTLITDQQSICVISDGNGDGGNGDGNGDGDTHAACNDQRDNDNDGLIDYPNDPGCTSQRDISESNPTPIAQRCNDQRDNDNDGLIDYPNDPGCTSISDNSEEDILFECNDQRDNDNDGLIDYPNDPGCDSPADSDESDTTEFPKVFPFTKNQRNFVLAILIFLLAVGILILGLIHALTKKK